MISANVIQKTCNPSGEVLVTMELNYPRFIHSEVMTHRVFSRNAASSRAQPVKKVIDFVKNHPAIPIHWGKNQKGMSASEELNTPVQFFHDEKFGILVEEYSPEEAWLLARDRAVEIAQAFEKAGYHKQVVNRLLEPFFIIKVIVTSSYWQNFINLRNSEAAQPEIVLLAREISKAISSSETTYSVSHIPWILPEEENLSMQDKIKVSVARSARVSYKTFEDSQISTIEKDTSLFTSLANDMHLSPFEHVAFYDQDAKEKGLNGNFSHTWSQFRKIFEQEFKVETQI